MKNENIRAHTIRNQRQKSTSPTRHLLRICRGIEKNKQKTHMAASKKKKIPTIKVVDAGSQKSRTNSRYEDDENDDLKNDKFEVNSGINLPMRNCITINSPLSGHHKELRSVSAIIRSICILKTFEV